MKTFDAGDGVSADDACADAHSEFVGAGVVITAFPDPSAADATRYVDITTCGCGRNN